MKRYVIRYLDGSKASVLEAEGYDVGDRFVVFSHSENVVAIVAVASVRSVTVVASEGSI